MPLIPGIPPGAMNAGVGFGAENKKKKEKGKKKKERNPPYCGRLEFIKLEKKNGFRFCDSYYLFFFKNISVEIPSPPPALSTRLIGCEDGATFFFFASLSLDLLVPIRFGFFVKEE